MLNAYLQQVQRLLRDQRQGQYNPADLILHINRARRELAGRTQCIRAIPPIAGSIASITVTSGGSGYGAPPAVTISAPDSPNGAAPNPNGLQATATATLSGSAVNAIAVGTAGSGYFQPTVTVAGNATATAATTATNVTAQGQEIYTFAAAPSTGIAGVSSILAVFGVAVIWSGTRYELDYRPFNRYQTEIRAFQKAYQSIPAVWSQYGQGGSGSIFIYPIPSAVYQMEWDCICLPIDLASDADAEAIPAPWTDAVVYYAAHFALLESDMNAAMALLKMYETAVHHYSSYARVGARVNIYPRYG